MPPMQPTWKLGLAGSVAPGFGIRVDQIWPNSPAERMGLEKDDYIVQINGNPIRTFQDYDASLAASNGFVRILSWDNRTQSYQWVQGSLQ